MIVTIQRREEAERAGKVARLQADNARLRKLAADFETDVRQLRLAVAMNRGRSAVEPAHRLRLIEGR
jgi:hypothetical protein